MRSRRRPLVLIILSATLLVLLVGGGAVAELVLRQIVPERFSAQIREALSLSTDHPVEVELNGWVTSQIVRGKLHDVSIRVPNAPLAEGMRADLFGSAEVMPVKPTENEIEGAVVGARFSGQQLHDVLDVLTRGIGQDIKIDGDQIVVSTSVSMFGSSMPIELTFAPSVRDGEVHIDPTSLRAAGVVNITMEQLQNVPGGMFEGIADGLDICVADRIPEGATLTGIALSTTQSVTIEVELDPRIGRDPALQSLGSC